MDACRKGYIPCNTRKYFRCLTAYLISQSDLMSAQISPGCPSCSPMARLPVSRLRSYIPIRSPELAVTKIKEAQEMYSLKSRCFLESTGIYHIPLLCFLHDKGFDCSVINPIITKNSTNSNIRKLHNDKFDSKRQQGLGLMLLLRLLSSLMTKSSTFGTWCATTITTKICSLLLS